MCATALLLGQRPRETQGRVLAGLVAAACMVPCRVLLPKLYRSANTPLVTPTPLPSNASMRRVRGGALDTRGGPASVGTIIAS
jgi:hypothetical protein